MYFKQKLAYMALGCLFTIIGYILASLSGNPVDAQSQRDKSDPTVIDVDRVVCRELRVVNDDGETVVVITDTLGGLIGVKHPNYTSAGVLISAYPNGGSVTVNHASGKKAVEMAIDIKSKEGFVQVGTKDQKVAEYEAEKKASERKAVDFTRDTDRLMAARTFIIHDKKRVFKAFDLTGKLIEEKKDTLQDGVMSYTITSPTTAIIFGNVGSAEVEFTRADRSITFIETTPAGNKNIMVIYDEWDDKEKGFRFIYTRNIKSPMINELMKTTATGIAKIN